MSVRSTCILLIACTLMISLCIIALSLCVAMTSALQHDLQAWLWHAAPFFGIGRFRDVN